MGRLVCWPASLDAFILRGAAGEVCRIFVIFDVRLISPSALVSV